MPKKTQKSTKVASASLSSKSQFTRPPVVTLLGHVDHGKTSILDKIRQTHLQAREAGGITQGIGAYQVEHQGQKITFIDTPGHEAFTAMRARGGEVADLAILVVAADDGVKPQTIEAIDHAKAAQVPILVAVNKIDLPSGNTQKVLNQLIPQGVLTEKTGGDTVAVEVSAKTGEGISDLLEMIVLLTSMQELKADVAANPAGVVLEGSLDEKQGVVATLLIKEGTLKLGQVVVTGNTWGKLRRMVNWQGQVLKEALPATPVQVLGLRKVPLAGENFERVENEKEAQSRLAAKLEASTKPSVEKKLATETNKIKLIRLIIKTDAQGSLEAVHHILEKLQTEEVRLEYVHEGVGNITETDIMLAATTHAIVLGFRVGVDQAAENAARLERVIYRTYEIIYHLLEEVEEVIEGELIEPAVVRLGLAKIQEVFVLSDGTRIAGCRVEEGKIARGHSVRVLRGEEVLGKSQVVSLRVGKEKVDRVKKGEECGISLRGGVEFEKGDLVESIQE